jgi:hypothetical protein
VPDSYTEERHRTGARHCSRCDVRGTPANCWVCGRFTSTVPMMGLGGRCLAGVPYKYDPNMTHFNWNGVLEIENERPF